LVAIAVETNGALMGRAYLKTIESLKMVELEKFVKDHVTQGARVSTDYYPSYGSLENYYDHISVSNFTTGKKIDVLPKAHIVVANLKMWLRGTYNCLPAKHLQRYLDEFVFRFNRRWNIENIFNKLLIRCIYTNTITYAELTG
jgi:hypothetical protein